MKNQDEFPNVPKSSRTSVASKVCELNGHGDKTMYQLINPSNVPSSFMLRLSSQLQAQCLGVSHSCEK